MRAAALDAKATEAQKSNSTSTLYVSSTISVPDVDKILLAASVLLLVGAAVVSLAQNFPVLLLGRALQGLGSGVEFLKLGNAGF